MKIGIIGFIDKNKIPYLEFYEKEIQKENIEYNTIFWDRFNSSKTEKNNNEYIIRIKCIPGESKFKKLIPMFLFKLEVEKIIEREQYTHLIILTTIPGVLFSKTLLDKFKNKYILDIRDYTYEKYGFYKNIVEKLIEKSYFTSISSKGFLKFLPKSEKIIACHNISNSNSVKTYIRDIKNKTCITIGFVGGVRYFKENCKLIDAFANNPKYKLAYIGKANLDCDLKSYCKQKNITNVMFSGQFNNKDKPQIYEQIDLINAVYGNESLEVTTALPNRLYDGILFKKPLISTYGTYLGSVVEKYKVGIALNLNKDIAEQIKLFLDGFEKEEFVNAANRLLNIVNDEQNSYINKIREFLENEKNIICNQ